MCGRIELLARMLYDDVLVVADAVFDGMNQTIRHRPSPSFVEGNCCEVLDPRMQLEVVIILDCIGVIGMCHPYLDVVHVPFLDSPSPTADLSVDGIEA
jgi:hypothetical protein